MQDGSKVEIRALRVSDCPGLTACLLRCYGDGYYKKSLYDAPHTAALVQGGHYAGVVALLDGQMIGHIGLTRAMPNAIVFEAGTTIVDERFRGAGVMGQMAGGIRQWLLAQGAVGFMHFPTTAHTVMQRVSLVHGACETGVLVACIPSSMRDSALGGPLGQRLCVTAVYQPLAASASQDIYLPESYAAMILDWAQQLGLFRVRVDSARPSEVHGSTQLQASQTLMASQFDAARGIVSVAVHCCGADLAQRVYETPQWYDGAIFHVDLPLNDPGTPAAVHALRTKGFVFGAWLPGWKGHDVLRMQRVVDATASELAPQLYSEPAKSLMGLVLREMSIGRAIH